MVTKSLRSLLDYLIYGNIYLALSGLLCGYGVALSFGLPFTPSLAIVEFSAILSLYSLNRYMELKQDFETYPVRTNFIKRGMYLFMAATVLFYTSALILCFIQNIDASLFILLLTLSMIIYGLRIGNFRLKDVLLVKNIYVGFLWSVSLVILPQIFFKTTIQYKTTYYVIFTGMLTMINTIIFDLRDLRGDIKNKVRTFPVVFGPENVKKLVASMTFITLLFSITLYVDLGKEYTTFILTTLCMLLVISRINTENIKIVSEVYTDAWFGIFGFFNILSHLVLM